MTTRKRNNRRNDESEECNMVMENFGSCEEFEIISLQTIMPVEEKISRYVKERIKETNQIMNWEEVRI